MNYTDAIGGILIEAKGCPEDLAVRVLRQSVIKWCQDTYCMVNPATIVTTADDPGLLVVDTSQITVLDIIDAVFNGEPIDVLGINDERARLATESYPALVFNDPSQAEMVPTPTAPTEVDLLLAVAPGRTSDEFPDFIWQTYSEPIEHGALSRLLAVPGRPWSNPAVATYHSANYERAAMKAAAFIGKKRTHRGQRLRVKPI